jgi:predicted Ser/Thr protein kinase
MDQAQFLDGLQERLKDQFHASEQVLSFEEFLERFRAEPSRFLRSAPQYLIEMFDHFGTSDTTRVGQDAKRHRLFDLDADIGTVGLVGQERAQSMIHRYLESFAKRGKADKMLLLHGPNGSGKTTVIENIIRGLEAFSQTSEGILMTFSWVFSENEGRLKRIGFEAGAETPESVDDLDSLAHLDVSDVSARFGCELHDSPLFLIPVDERAAFVEEVIDSASTSDCADLNYDRFLEGDLCQKCRKIYDTLLVAYDGDWRKVIRHVRVERFVISKRYRSCAVSIEPQGNVDSGTQPITSEHSWHIPIELRNATLYQPVGDIVDANRGVLEYSDFLKRSLEMNKYLLTTCERGTASLQNCMAYLDLVIFATANEKQLSVFKRSPDFSSFKGRMELISVPYLLRYSTEVELYRRQIRSFSRDRHVTPHAATVAALWAVLTRLRKPVKEDFSEPLASAVTRLTPLEKSRLYDSGEPPDHFTDEERKALKAGVLEVRGEFEEHEAEFEGMFGAEYEGRRGVSPREMLTLLSRAAETRTFQCLTPMAVLGAIEELIRDVSLYDFLRLPAEDGYHDVHSLLADVRREYLRWVRDEVYDSIGLSRLLPPR